MRGAKVYPDAERYAAAWTVTLGVVLALVVLVTTGCTISPEYVKADRKTFDAVAIEYMHYVDGDGALSKGQKDRRNRTIDSWNKRLVEEEDKDK